MLTLHKVYEGELGNKKEALFVSDGGPARKLKGAALAKFLVSIAPGTPVLSTSSNPKDALLIDLLGRGVEVRRAHWHSTGIEKGLPPEEIAQAFAALPVETTAPLTVRPEILQLGQLVDTRQAFIEHRKADTLRLKGLARAFGIQDGEALPADLAALEAEINADKRKAETPVDKKIAKLAASVPECVAFNVAAGLSDGWNTAALVVGELVDVGRFPRVASLWHYSGQHVVDGKAPKRARGTAQDWNPKLRTALWNLGTSIIKNRENRWRTEYERYVAQEKATHAVKCPGCKTPDGHCGARARRRVVKEILKEFFSLCSKGQNTNDTHCPSA